MSTTDIILIHKNIAKRQLWTYFFNHSHGRTHSWRYSTFYKRLKNVSCEYDRLNGWNSTLQAAWYIRHVRIICFLWTINKPTIRLLKISFAKYRSRVFYVLSLWRIYCIKNTTVRNLTPPANLALIPQQHVIHQASKYNRYQVYAITLRKLLEFLLVLDSMWYTNHRSRYNRTIGSST